MTVIAKCLPSGNRAVAAALALAQRGLCVFPCGANKKTPIMAGGFKQASTNPDTITTWWEDWTAANVAVATGAVSGVVVLDVDVKHDKDGEAALTALERKNGPCPRRSRQLHRARVVISGFSTLGAQSPAVLARLRLGSISALTAAMCSFAPSYVIEPEYRGAYAWSVDSASEVCADAGVAS